MRVSAFAPSSAPVRGDCILLAAVLLLLSACTTGSGAGQPATGNDDGWHLTLEQSGGFAGVHKRYTLDSSSDVLVVEDLRRASRISRPLTRDERKQLSKLVAAREGAPAVPATGGACPDCFEFTITVESAGKPRSAHYDSRTLAGSPDDSLVTWILKVSAPAPK